MLPSSLPIEVIEVVFKFAARSSQKACLTLCLVSSWARKVALSRLLYAIEINPISYKRAPDPKLVLRHLKSPPLRPFNEDFHHASLVRNIYINALSISPECWDILACSKNTTTLAIRTSSLRQRHLLPVSQPLINLESLMLYIDVVYYVRGKVWFKVFERPGNYASIINLGWITHLCLMTAVQTPEMSVHDFQKFPRLTHLAISVRPDVHDHSYDSGDDPHFHPLGQQINILPRGIEVCVFVFDSDEYVIYVSDWLREMRKSDPRVYGFCSYTTTPMEEIWKKDTNGDPRVWDSAIQWTELMLEEPP